MKRNELKQVHNFKIWNNFGSIEYPEPTDLIGVNIDDLVFIEHKQAEVYPDPSKKPKVGLKLNKRAIITLNDINSTEEKLRIKVNKIEDTKFISYDQNAKILKFEVAHFTKYGVTDDESEEEEKKMPD